MTKDEKNAASSTQLDNFIDWLLDELLKGGFLENEVS